MVNRTLLSVTILLLSFTLFAQQYTSAIDLSVADAVLYRDAGALHRVNTVVLYKGQNLLKLGELGEGIDLNSIDVTCEGQGVEVLSFVVDSSISSQHRERLHSIRDSIEWLTFDLKKMEQEAFVLKEQSDLLTLNKKRIGTDEGLDAIDLQEAVEYYGKQLLSSSSQLLSLQQKMDDTKMMIDNHQRNLEELSSKSNVSLNIIVQAAKMQQSKLAVYYNTSALSWLPYYTTEASLNKEDNFTLKMLACIKNESKQTIGKYSLSLRDQYLNEKDSSAVFTTLNEYNLNKVVSMLGDGREYRLNVDTYHFKMASMYQVDLANETVIREAFIMDLAGTELCTGMIKIYQNNHMIREQFLTGSASLKQLKVLLEASKSIALVSNTKDGQHLINQTDVAVSFRVIYSLENDDQVDTKQLELLNAYYDESEQKVTWNGSIRPGAKKKIFPIVK